MLPQDPGSPTRTVDTTSTTRSNFVEYIKVTENPQSGPGGTPLEYNNSSVEVFLLLDEYDEKEGDFLSDEYHNDRGEDQVMGHNLHNQNETILPIIPIDCTIFEFSFLACLKEKFSSKKLQLQGIDNRHSTTFSSKSKFHSSIFDLTRVASKKNYRNNNLDDDSVSSLSSSSHSSQDEPATRKNRIDILFRSKASKMEGNTNKVATSIESFAKGKQLKSKCNDTKKTITKRPPVMKPMFLTYIQSSRTDPVRAMFLTAGEEEEFYNEKAGDHLMDTNILDVGARGKSIKNIISFARKNLCRMAAAHD